MPYSKNAMKREDLLPKPEASPAKIDKIFDEYAKERLIFATTLADMACHDEHVPFLSQEKVLTALQYFLVDEELQVQQMTIIALGRMSDRSKEIAEKIVEVDAVRYLFAIMDPGSLVYHRALMFLLRALCKHSAWAARKVVTEGGLQFFKYGLQSPDHHVRLCAAWGLGYVARHNESLAEVVVRCGAVQLLKQCLSDKRLSIKQVAAAGLRDIVKHRQKLAEAVESCGVGEIMCNYLQHPDVVLKSNVLKFFNDACHNSKGFANILNNRGAIVDVISHLNHPNENVRKEASMCLLEIVRRSIKFADTVVESGGIACLVHMLENSTHAILPAAVATLGVLASYSRDMAMKIAKTKAVETLCSIIGSDREEDLLLLVSVAALQQVCHYSPSHARPFRECGGYEKLFQLFCNQHRSYELRLECKEVFAILVEVCEDIELLTRLLLDNYITNVVFCVVQQLAKIVSLDLEPRRTFLQLGGLKRLQELKTMEIDKKTKSLIEIVNLCYPKWLVNCSSPDFPDHILDMIEEYGTKPEGENEENEKE